MTDSFPTIWPIEPHTHAKHFILKRYLQAWFPILSKRNTRILYLDAFAGPGRYQGGEDGSPIIAIKTAIDHNLPLAKEIIFYFIEARDDRRQYLETVLHQTFPTLPTNMKCHVSGANFAEELRDLLTILEEEKSNLAPTFAFLDPFGFKDMPMDIVARLLEYNKCETLITFMYKFINRFSESGIHDNALDELFGTHDWSKVKRISDPTERCDFLLNLYQIELRKRVPNIYIRNFEMIDSNNQVLYYLIYCTKNLTGLKVMKDTMWRKDITGSYKFSDRTDPSQKTLFELANEPIWIPVVADLIYQKYKGKTVQVEDIEKFVIVDTPYCFRKKILILLESDHKIIRVMKRQRANTYPDGCIIQFL